MDKPESASPAAEEAPPPARSPRRAPLLMGVAIVALAGLLFSLAGLRGNTTSSSDVDLAALAAQSPMAVPLYEGLSQQQAQGSASTAAAQEITIMNYQFSPSNLTIAVGDSVTWTNHDTAPHNVIVTDGPEKFESPLLQTGQTFTYTFTMAGTYSYYCSVHPDMKATVTVTGSETTPPTTTEPNTPTTEPSTPSSEPTTSTSSSTPTSTTSGGCVSNGVLEPLLAHIKAAHLETSPGQQVADLLQLDSYVKMHTVWLEQVLAPVMDGTASSVVTDTLAPIWAHIKSAHLETSLGQQVQDLLNLDSYIKMHTVWLEQVLTPLLNQVTC